MEIDDIRRRGQYLTTEWLGQDAWYARLVGDETYLMVSRRRIDPPVNLRGRPVDKQGWTHGWRWARRWRSDGAVIAEGPIYWELGLRSNPNVPTTYADPLEAIAAADKHAAEVWKT